MKISDSKRLVQVLAGRNPLIWISTCEEPDALAVVRDAAGTRGMELLEWSVSQGLRDGLSAAAPLVPNTEHPAGALAYLLTLNRPIAAALLDLVAHLKDERVIRLAREVMQKFSRTGGSLIVIDPAVELPPALRAVALRFELSLPDEKELEEICRQAVRTAASAAGGKIQIELTRQDLDTIVRNLRGLNARQARQVIMDVCCFDRRFDASDVNEILAEKRRHLEGDRLLEYIESPVSLDEIGGLRRLKFWLEQRRESLCDEAVEFGIQPPRGVLMLGVQGAGKSLSAKAVATAWQRPLLRMDVGALYDRYIGESERRLREAFRQAEMMAPIILWIDEIEKAFASAASHSADGGLSKRMFGSLLTWMQEHKAPVFLIATANEIEALPPELLRKGRFDEIFFVDLPDSDARRMIFSIHLARRKQDVSKFDLERLAQSGERFSGAEIEQAIVSAMHNAFARRVQLTTELIIDGLQTSPPLSVTMAEKVESLRRWAEGRCVPAD